MSDTYGVDIAIRRHDDLDRKVLAYVKGAGGSIASTRTCHVLDVGSGAGGLSVALALNGALVTAVDIETYDHHFRSLRQRYNLTEEQLCFIHGDIRQSIADSEGGFEVCVMQRVLHYVPYGDAQTLLRYMRQHVQRLYISVTGIDTDIGKVYKAKREPIEKRFSCINKGSRDTFSIHVPVCLYTPEEFMVLLQDSGWYIQEYWISAFGNIKAVCT